VNCKVTIPWWDTSKNAGSPWNVSPWGAAIDLLGTNSSCVTDGGFASPGWQPNNAHGCLSRTFSLTLPTAMQEGSVLAMPPSDYGAFSDALQTQIHNVAHVAVGGTMLQSWSPEAPEFFLHHGHIDKLWNDWQQQGNANLIAYSFPLTTVMPVAFGTTPGEYMSLQALKVIYVQSSLSVLGAGHPVLYDCNILTLPLMSINLTTLRHAIAKATPAQLNQIPQLAAPILTSAQEQMMIASTRTGRGTAAQIQAQTRVLAAAHDKLTKVNAALQAAGSLRASFADSTDMALGFDVAQAVKVLKIPLFSGPVPLDQPSGVTPPPGSINPSGAT